MDFLNLVSMSDQPSCISYPWCLETWKEPRRVLISASCQLSFLYYTYFPSPLFFSFSEDGKFSWPSQRLLSDAALVKIATDSPDLTASGAYYFV